VDNARKMIGKTIDIAVTSVLQTTAGKMIFGKWDERAAARQEAAKPLSGVVAVAAVPTSPLGNGPAPEAKKTPHMAERPVE
jgi:hypothetical protein